jgi:hypothetical protein
MSELAARSGGSEPAGLEWGYRRLLACYPRAYRRENEEEILGVLLACAGNGQQRPRLAETADLLKGALWMRLRPARRPPRTVQAGVWLMCAGVAAELAYLIINVATVGSVGSAYARRYPPWAAAVVHHVVTVRVVEYEVGGVIGVGVCVLLAGALAQGRNLARFAVAAVFALDFLAQLHAIGRGAAVNAQADTAAAFAAWVLILAAILLLFTGPSNRYYRPKARPAPLLHPTVGTS